MDAIGWSEMTGTRGLRGGARCFSGHPHLVCFLDVSASYSIDATTRGCDDPQNSAVAPSGLVGVYDL